MGEEKKTYPMLPIAHWWALRRKFKQSIPGVVTDSYLATVLDMGENSARANVLPFLRVLGIIDEEGKTGERARLWRDDEHYPQVCGSILKEVYPAELLDAVPNPAQERNKAERWFANVTGAGEAAVKRMAALYTVLVKAEVSEQTEQEKAERPRKVANEREATKPLRKAKPEPSGSTHAPNTGTGHLTDPAKGPGININLEIHISADSTPEQIDQIFASMAKHIYQRG